MYEKISAVPTNIITGFLGVGKTTAILNLLKNKPDSERWAVLVNEFGEVGIDGSLFKGQHTEDTGVFIREVLGGCMCCAAGLPMQIALNQLLMKAKPDRLLIEPTGLGHPKEVLQVLAAKHYSSVLQVQKTITLVDARKLHDPRYTTNDTFNQQIEVADVVVGNKQDLYQDGDHALLESYVLESNVLEGNVLENRIIESREVVFSQHGELAPELLSGESKSARAINLQSLVKQQTQSDRAEGVVIFDEQTIPECGYIQITNEGEGYQSIGWRFSADVIFDYSALFNWLNGLTVERMKAVFITHEGIFAYNMTPDSLLETELDESIESRIEIIAADVDPQWEKDLLKLAQRD